MDTKTYGKPRPTFDELVARGRLIAELHAVAERYTATVAQAMRQEGTPLPDLPKMQLGLAATLKAVHEHTPIDTERLTAYDDLTLCMQINQALEKLSSAGRFKEGYRPEWLS